ncbi:hypothetical protein Aperf_G00000094887 [Anoplocephala perfoliata]
MNVLSSLQNEHRTTLEELHKTEEADGKGKSPKVKSLKSLVNKIEQAIDEGKELSIMTDFFQSTEAEKLKLKAPYKCIVRENRCLEEELTNLHAQNRQSQVRIVALEGEMEELKFASEISKCDTPDQSGIPEGDNGTETGNGQGEDKSDPNLAMNSIQGTMFSHIMSNYEISVRLWTLLNLIIQYDSEGYFEVADPLCKQVLEELEKYSDYGDPDIVTMLHILALIYMDQGKYREASHFLNKALTIQERNLGPRNPDVASILDDLAVLYGKRGKYHKAEPLSKRGVKTKEEVLGKDHPDVAKTLNNLALLCQNQSKYVAASAYLKQAKYMEAETLYKDIITRAHELVYGKITNENTPIWMLAEDKQNGKWDPSLATQVLNQNSALMGNPTLATSMRNLGALYHRSGKFDAAEVVKECVGRPAK